MEINFYFCANMKRDDINICDIENEVSSYFGVNVSDFYMRLGVRNIYTARHYLWLLLHDEYGLSHREISKIYPQSKRMIEKAISGIRFRVENQRQDRERYEALKSLLLI